MWMSTNKVFPHNKPVITKHNLRLLKQFYLTQQHKHYHDTIEKNFHQKQSKDIRYIDEPLQLPLVQMYIKECNPDSSINIAKPTIQIQHDKALIFTNKGNHLITILKNRLEWLWHQYNTNSSMHHQLDPPCQLTIWNRNNMAIQKIRIPNPKNKPPQKISLHTSYRILDQIITLFNIKTSYFSSPVTCSTFVNMYYSPFQRDSIFGSTGTTFERKWLNNGYAYPYNKEDVQKAIH